MYFSINNKCFYPLALKDDYDNAGTWPADAVQIDASTETMLKSAIRNGDTITEGANGFIITPKAATPLADLQKAALKSIDADVDAIYSAVVGNRAPEYAKAESDAIEYKAAGYPSSPVPPYVQDWATAKTATPAWSADNIIETATQWRSAQGNLRANRLSTKELVRTATDKKGIDSALASWAIFVSATKTGLNI